jgi:hypothetical protein
VYGLIARLRRSRLYLATATVGEWAREVEEEEGGGGGEEERRRAVTHSNGERDAEAEEVSFLPIRSLLLLH